MPRSRRQSHSISPPLSPSHFENVPFLPTSPLLEKHSQPSAHAPVTHRLSRWRLLLTGLVLAGGIWGLLLFLLPTPTLAPEPTQDTHLSVIPLSPATTSAPSPWTLTLPPLALSNSALSKTCQAVHNHTHHATYLRQRPIFTDPTANLTPADCPATLTFVLPSHPLGLAETLLQLFTAHSLAIAENRTLHIDDSQWTWGRLDSYLLAPEIYTPPDCMPPERKKLLPCPAEARHRVLTHDIRKYEFGHEFHHKYEIATKARTERQRRIWELAADGMSQFVPVDEVADRVQVRVNEIQLKRDNWTALAVRRGDVKTKMWRYRKGWLPVERYFHDYEKEAGLTGDGILLMTDDSDVYDLPELKGAEPALGGNGAGTSGGWRRGDMEDWTQDETIKAGREWLSELMVVAEAADEVRCMGGSATCRLLGVGMGWDRMMKRWGNVDGGWGWKGIDW